MERIDEADARIPHINIGKGDDKMWTFVGIMAVIFIGLFIELWTDLGLVTFFFILFLFNVIIIPFRNKILWDNKHFKGKYVTAEIIYYDQIQEGKKVYDVTIVNYEMNGKSIDALLDGKKGKKIGEKIEIVTDGEVAFCVKKGWRDIFDDIKMVILFVPFGYLFFKNFSELNFYCVVFCSLLAVFLIIIHPITYRNFIKGLKAEAGWHENL